MSDKNQSGNQFGYGYNSNQYDNQNMNGYQDPYQSQYGNQNMNGYTYQQGNPNMMGGNIPYQNQFGDQNMNSQPYTDGGFSYNSGGGATYKVSSTTGNSKIGFIVGLIFFFVGICFVFASVGVGISSRKFYKTAEKTEATIAQIETYRDRDGDIQHSVYVDYTYDGADFGMVRLNFYSSSMYEGKTIDIYVDPENPRHIKTKGGDILMVVVFGAIGGIFSVIGLISAVVSKKKKYN